MKFSWLVLFWGLLFMPLFFSCEPEEEDIIDKTHDSIIAVNKYVNNWILENMETYYFWTDKIPSETDDTLSPDMFFESLLYKFNATTAPDGDRFSWIQDDYEELQDMLSGVSSNEIGFDYQLYLMSANGDLVIGQVTYTKKGTPAETAGIKRGWWFNRINGTALTTSNYRSLMSFTAASVIVGFVDEIYNQDGTFKNLTNGKDITIQTLSGYSEDPVYMNSLYVYNQSKIGYLIYNFFAPDGGDGNLVYDKKLNSIFGKFKTAGITDLVLDLRYNSGGYSSSGQHLASMIVPNLSTTNIYTYYRYNNEVQSYYTEQYGADYFKTYFTDWIKNGETKIEQLNNAGTNLTRVYILTGQYTASASEQLINGLKPYMNVILIGDVTYGKNVASISFYEENDSKNKWGMQPIVAKFFNSLDQSDFTAGFTPDYEVNDTGEPGIKQLGDVTEKLLNTALVNATGISTIRSAIAVSDRIVQKDKTLANPHHIQRGLIIDKLPILDHSLQR